MGEGIQKQFEKHPLNSSSIEWRLWDSHKQTMYFGQISNVIIFENREVCLARKVVYVCVHAHTFTKLR